MSKPENAVLDATERLFRERCGDEVLASANAGAWSGEFWDELAAFGLPMALVSEDQGGLGLSMGDAYGIAQLCGQFAVPLPVVETMLANWLLTLAGLPARDGPQCLLFEGLSVINPTGGRRLVGTCPTVPWGRNCAPVAWVQDAELSYVVALGKSQGEVAEGINIANEPRDALTIDADMTGQNVAVCAADPALTERCAALRCVQMAGAMATIGEMSIAFAMEREQFGRPLAKFQAIQQSLAVLAEQVALASVAAQMASDAVSASSAQTLAIASAKARVGEAAGDVAATAHQVHGAIGFSEEYRLHYFTRRLWSWRDEFGNETSWYEQIGRAIAKAGPDRLWSELTEI